MPKVIHTLAAVDRVAVCGGQSIRQVILTAKTVAAVLRLPVDRIACNADGICLLLDQRHVVAARAVSCGHGRGYLVRAGVAAVNAVIFVNKRLMSMLLRPQRAGYIFRAIHHAAALVVEAQNRRHTVPSGAALECGSNRFVVSNASRAGTCPGRKTGDEGLLFHSRTCLQRARHIAQIPHLIPLIGGKGHDAVSAGGHPTVDAERGRYIACQVAVVAVKALHSFVRLRHEGLHLHIRRCQQCAGHAVQVDALVSLVDVVRF